MTKLTAEQIARLFHETYERLAPKYGYKTRKASRVPWEEVPEANKRLMVAVAREVYYEIAYLIGERVEEMASEVVDYGDDENACNEWLRIFDHVSEVATNLDDE